MHLCARVVERGNAEEDVILRLPVVMLLRHAGTDERPVPVQNGLREARRAGGEVDRGVVLFVKRNRRRTGGTEAHQSQAVLGVGRHVPADKQPDLHAGQALLDGIQTADKLRSEDQHLHIGKIETVGDLV